jgi:hypothetical protein
LQGGAANAPGSFVYVDGSTPNSGSSDADFSAQSQYAYTGSGNMYGPVTTLTQDLTSAVQLGEYYQITFYLANEFCSISDPGCGLYFNYFDAYFGGVQLSQQYNVTESATDIGTGNLDYTKYQFVVGGRTTDVLQFDFTNDDGGFHLDDASVTAIGPTPEPASFLLVAPALAGLLYFKRRRRAA